MQSQLPPTRTHLGKTKLAVTNLCFGTSGLGNMPDTYGYAVDEQRAWATIRAIFDGPVNFIDSSRIYGDGRSEQRIGDVIRERGGLPKDFVVSTKLDRDFATGGAFAEISERLTLIAAVKRRVSELERHLRRLGRAGES